MAQVSFVIHVGSPNEADCQLLVPGFPSVIIIRFDPAIFSRDFHDQCFVLNCDTHLTEFRQPLQVQSHLEMPRILVQLGHTQRTWKLAPQTDPKWSPTRSSTRYQDQISVRFTRRKLRMPSFTRAPHAQPSLSNFTRRDSDFGEPTRSRGTTRLERNFPTSPQNKKDQTYTSFAIHVIANNINPTCKLNIVLTLIGLPQRSQP